MTSCANLDTVLVAGWALLVLGVIQLPLWMIVGRVQNKGKLLDVSNRQMFFTQNSSVISIFVFSDAET